MNRFQTWQPWRNMRPGWRLAGWGRGQITGRWAIAALAGAGIAVIPALVAPPAVQAYTSRHTVFLVRAGGESFDTLVQRSEIVARAAIQRSFDVDVLITDVVITVVGDNQGIAIPILMVPVSRNDWQANPDVRAWARYFEASRNLANE